MRTLIGFLLCLVGAVIAVSAVEEPGFQGGRIMVALTLGVCGFLVAFTGRRLQ